MSLCVDDNDNRVQISKVVTSQSNVDWSDAGSDSDLEELRHDEKVLNECSDEDESLLVIYQTDNEIDYRQ